MAADNDRKAIAVAADNFQRNNVAPQILAFAGDGYKSNSILSPSS